MKKILNLFLIGALLVSLAFGFGACDSNSSEEAGATVKYINGQYTLTKYVQEEDVTELIIDQTKDGKQITAIKAGAFAENEGLLKITVGAGVEEIAAGAFKGMKSLQEITLPFVGAKAAGNVNEKRLFGYVFGSEAYDEGIAVTQSYDPTNSATYYFPETLEKVTVTGGAEYELPAYAFYGCSHIKELTITDAASFGNSAFAGCSYLTAIEVPANVTTIGSEAFVGCNRLKTVSFGGASKLTTIGNAAFEGAKFSSIVLPAGVTSLGEELFRDSNVEVVNIPDGVTEIPYYAFAGCARLKTVTITATSTLATIAVSAFQGCDALTGFTIPASVTEIGSYAFADCDSLTAAFKASVEAVATVSENVFGYQA